MELNETNKENSNNKLYLTDIFIKFLSISEVSENEKIIINKIKPIFFLYSKKIIELYINNINENNIRINKKTKRNFNYIVKYFINNIIGKNKFIFLSDDFPDKIFFFFVIFCFIIFREVSLYKNSVKYSDIKDLVLTKLDKLLSKIIIFIDKLFTDKIIDVNKYELSLKFLIILSISFKRIEEPNKNDKIVNMMFFKECINTIKLVFSKIYESQKKFNEEQENLLNNIILFIRKNIIEYTNQKPINIINKSYLSNNDYYTSSLLDLIFIISKMNNIEIINNFIELLTNIYSFSFRYNNMMTPLVKMLEPLLTNINLKKIEEINYEINISKFPLKLLNGLIDKEEKILKEDPTLLKSGFYLGNKICGITSELDNLGDDFLLIFGFSLHEINNEINKIKEWTIINIRNKEKDKDSQIKIWLSQIENKNNQYNLIISIKNKKYNTKIIIISKKTYIFSFHFIKTLTTKKVKICYTSESDAFPINELEEISIQNFNTDNTNIYIGCDIHNSINLIQESNTFTGFIGTIIIINQKKLSKKNPEEISKLFLSLKGDYASIILMSLENKEYKSFLISHEIKNYNKNEFLYNQTHDRIIELNEKASDLKFVESIKTIISPNSFRLVEYKDEVDYLNIENNYELYECYRKENISIRQNFLDFKQKTISSKTDKMIKIFTSFFNNKFHIFENKNSLEEFIKYDGIYYLCLLLEYYYQIIYKINTINKDNTNKNVNNKYINDMYIQIENNIYEILEFFMNKIIINKNYCKNFIKEINHFLYQISILLKKYMTIHNINKKFLDLISSMIKTFINYIQDEKEEDSYPYINEFIKIRNKLLDLLHNLCLFFYDDTEFNTKIEFYIDLIYNLLINDYLNDLFSTQFIDKLLSLAFIFDNSNSFIKKNKLTFKKLQTKYIHLLSQFLIIVYNDFCSKNKNENKTELRKSAILSFFDKNKKNKNEDKIKDEKSDNNFEYLNYYVEYSLQSVKFPYIFSNLLNVLYQAELIEIIPSIYMEQFQSILEQNYKHITENKNSQLISESSLRILSAYYLADKKKEKLLHDFLRNLTFYKGFFNSIISSLKQIKYISNDNKFIKKESEKNVRKISGLGSEDNDSTYSDTSDKNHISNEDLLPLLNLELDSLNKKQNHLLIALLQDCISMLFIEDTTQICENITESDAQEVYDILIKNFNAAFKFKGKNVYKDIFSSDKEITPELFYFKWKMSNYESNKLLIEDIKYFHRDLLKHHSFPFIFKFILLINLEEENKENNKEKNCNDNDDNELIIELLSFIYEELENYFKSFDIKNKSENDYNAICNLVNLLILINKIFIKRDNIFLLENSNFYDIFFKLIKILEKTGLLYSNYCFQFEENYGKIISEICYDLFIYLLNYSYKDEIKKQFKDTFIRENKQLKEFYTIFYLIDLNKEEILEKEKNTKKELMKYIKDYSSLRYIHNNIFTCKEPKKKINIFGKKISQINGVNFVIYFLSKTFLYLKSNISQELSSLLLDYFLPIIAENIFKLWTTNNSFYGHKICKRFLLYSEAKSFFEAHVIVEPDNFEIYKNFFNRDIPIKLKGQFELSYCFSSRLLDKKEDDYDSQNYILEGEKSKNKLKKTITFEVKRKKVINFSSFGLNYDNCFSSFENLDKKYIIYNPKNYLMKIIFSLPYNDAFFKDKIFEKIKASFLCNYRKQKTLIINTKQLNYPSKQKNFSNSLEPKTFLRRDYNFYKEQFFTVSHNYININLIKKNDIKSIYFYPHDYYSENIFNDKESTFYCELVTTQFLYFGRIYIGNDFICFQSEKDPRDNETNLNIKTFYQFAFSTRDNDNKTTKKKYIIIFIKDIKEIIIRRTLLMYQSLEIFIKNGKSYFFNFFKINLCNKAYDILNDINQKLLLENKKQFILSKDLKPNIRKVLSLKKKGEITNYEYLLYLNKLSSRTYNDLTQYPVFPWLILKMNLLFDITNSDESSIKVNSLINNENNSENQRNYIRDLNYPVSMQSPKRREEEIIKFLDDSKTSRFSYHCGTHYSTSSYIFYYLMRMNPYEENLIKLQNYKLENPNRMFLSFKETQLILETSADNRELIPDIYCYIDYLCNLNCSFLGIRNNSCLVDDFYVCEETQKFDNYTNIISTYVESLYRHKKLLNNKITPKNLDNWVDIIFGKRQIPNRDEASQSCNIFSKLTYEQFINLEKKLEKYKGLLEKGEIEEKRLKSKIQNKINIIINFGICPSQILTETINYEESPNQIIKPNKNIKKLKGNFYYFTKIKKNQYLSINEHLNKGTPIIRNVYIYEDNIDKEKYIYQCGNFENDINLLYKNNENSLYKPNYAISEIILINEFTQQKEIFILTSRFLGNYFKVQNSDRSLMILCEDFVTTIKSRNSEEYDNIFYTGLKNGKLIEWKIKIIQNNNLNNKKKNQLSSSFIIKEKKHIYAHKSSITAIEINNSKNIIATAGEDKFIYIRKLYDFEILTSIDLTYSFGNTLISKTPDIFPSLIKISDLNCIYVLLFNLSLRRTIIRGYTLNGLFFAQTDEFNTGNGSYDLYNNISFNKNWNLIVGLYNFKIILFNSYNLKPKCQKSIFEEDTKNKHKEIKWLEYDSSRKEFIILYNNECQIMSFTDDEQNMFDS